MSLVRLWRPSPNYSSGPHQGRLVVVHTSEGATTEASLSSYVGQSSSQVSYHVCFDNNGSQNTITEMVTRNNRSWSAMNANSWGVHGCCCTPSGASSGWSTAEWLNRPIMLAKCAAWISEECAAFGIPKRKIDAAAISRGESGVCGHWDCSAAGAGGGHTDPGAGFPWSDVLAIAGGGEPPPSPGPGPLPDWQKSVLIGQEWYPMAIFQSDADARQAAALTWWAQYLSRTPDATNLARWANRIVDIGYAGALNEFLHEPEVKNRLAKRPW